MSDLVTRLEPLPLVAILRGLEPARAVETGRILVDAGFLAIEVPLNSPEPFESIAALVDTFGARVLVGAGTVLTVADAARVAAAGGQLVVMPHADVRIVREAKLLGLACTPGVATPTEAFAALEAGADALKMFPAEALPPPVVTAWRAVLPTSCRLMPVGGIRPGSLAPYLAAGAWGFGLGSALFKPGMSAEQLRANAEGFVRAWREATARA